MKVKSLIAVSRKHAKAGLAAIALLALMAPATASSLTSISQGFLAYDNPLLGSIVSLQSNSSDYVRPATTSNVNNILGVVVDSGNSALSLASSKANQIEVVSSGVAPVLVSDINGKISAGDQITASPISGVGMKATRSVKVVGVAQDNLKANDKQTYTDKKGQKHDVMLGQIPVLVNVSYYYKQPEKTLIPAAVQNIANALAGKPVKPIPILSSLAIFVVTLIVVVSIIYAMIKSSIISVGRNPMSQAAVYRNLIQLSTLVLAILAVSLISIYTVLTRF